MNGFILENVRALLLRAGPAAATCTKGLPKNSTTAALSRRGNDYCGNCSIYAPMRSKVCGETLTFPRNGPLSSMPK